MTEALFLSDDLALWCTVLAAYTCLSYYVLVDVVFLLSLPVPGPQGSDTGGNNHTAFFIMMVWIVIAFVLYLLR